MCSIIATLLLHVCSILTPQTSYPLSIASIMLQKCYKISNIWKFGYPSTRREGITSLPHTKDEAASGPCVCGMPAVETWNSVLPRSSARMHRLVRLAAVTIPMISTAPKSRRQPYRVVEHEGVADRELRFSPVPDCLQAFSLADEIDFRSAIWRNSGMRIFISR